MKTKLKELFARFANIIVVTIITIIIFATIVCFSLLAKAQSGRQFTQSDEGRVVSIKWEEVNLREGYSTSEEIITTLYNGLNVTLTGASFHIAGGEGRATESWTEVKLKDGTTGWVVTSSIKWI